MGGGRGEERERGGTKENKEQQGVKCKEEEFQGQKGVQQVYCLTFFFLVQKIASSAFWTETR